MNKVIFVIRSRTDINILDGFLSRNSIRHQIINTPMSLRLSCGLSIITDETFLNEVRTIAAQSGVRINAIYRVISSEYTSKYFKLQ
ncbi:MAG: putative Se/S carrier-like protein [Clostridia bacterium]